MRKYEQTVEVFAKPGCSREPRKIPNESSFSQDAPVNPEKYQMKAHFLPSSVVYNIVPFYVLFIVHTHFSFCDL
jgi:hypothetical protein